MRRPSSPDTFPTTRPSTRRAAGECFLPWTAFMSTPTHDRCSAGGHATILAGCCVRSRKTQIRAASSLESSDRRVIIGPCEKSAFADRTPTQELEDGGRRVELVSSWVDYVGIAVYVISVIFIIALAFEKGGGWGGGMLLLGAVLWPVFCLF